MVNMKGFIRALLQEGDGVPVMSRNQSLPLWPLLLLSRWKVPGRRNGLCQGRGGQKIRSQIIANSEASRVTEMTAFPSPTAQAHGRCVQAGLDLVKRNVGQFNSETD